jgi:hypothetical protein
MGQLHNQSGAMLVDRFRKSTITIVPTPPAANFSYKATFAAENTTVRLPEPLLSSRAYKAIFNFQFAYSIRFQTTMSA